MDIKIGGDTLTKKPNILEEIAYRDTWGQGADSFIAMIYERLILMRDLLAEDGRDQDQDQAHGRILVLCKNTAL